MTSRCPRVRSRFSRPVGQPAYPGGWSPFDNLPGQRQQEKVASDRSLSPRRGPGEFRGRVKDEIRELIHATRNPERTREKIADRIDSTSRYVKAKADSNSSHHFAADELPALVEVLGDDVLHLIAAQAGGLFVRMPPAEPFDGESFCALVLEVQRATGAMAHHLLQADVAQPLDREQLQAIDEDIRAAQRALQRLMLALGRQSGGSR